MKNTKRILLAAVAALLLVAVSVGGTLAWLTATTTPVTNTFTPSDISITLTETFNTDTDKNGENDAWSAKMVPGAAIAKDPKVTVAAGSEACYLFVKVEKSTNLDDFISYTIAADWTQLKDAEGNDVAGVYYRQVPANADADQPFYVLAGDNGGQVTVNTGVTKADMNALTADNYPTLTFTAYAVQSANLSSTMTMEQIWALAQTNGSGT